LESVVFAIDAIAIITNPENTALDLSIEQLAGLFTGEITNWNEVGGPDAPVALIGREAGSGTRDGFESIIGVVDQCAYDQELNSGGAVIAAVASNPYAIGYASLSAVRDTVRAVLVNGVTPNEINILNGIYEVQRPFIFVLNLENELSEAAQAFIDFARSEEARSVLHNAGVIQPR
jgi:phosphate transport system substrate-binding protein